MKNFLNAIFSQKAENSSTFNQIWLNFINLTKNNTLKSYNFGTITPDTNSMPLEFFIYKNSSQLLVAIESARAISSLKDEGFTYLGISSNYSVVLKDEDYIAEITLKNQDSQYSVNVTFYMKGRGNHYEDYSCAEYR